jgi:hypothetical protein
MRAKLALDIGIVADPLTNSLNNRLSGTVVSGTPFHRAAPTYSYGRQN